MLTLPLESGYVNAFVYLVFDLVVVIFLAINLDKIQAAHVLRLISSGRRVRVSESPLHYIAGHIRADGTNLWILFSLLQLLVLIMLFIATLGINGRTEFIQIRTSRRDLTDISFQDRTFNQKRLSPPLFSSCAYEVGNGIHYFPAAFDTVDNVSISNEAQFMDRNGTSVKVNASSILCQNTAGFTPLLRVYSCGNGARECSNVNISTPKEIMMVGNSQAVLGGRKGGVIDQSGLFSLLDVPAGVLSNVHYSHLICSMVKVKKPTKGNMTYLCNAGVHDEVSFRYTFRIGQIEFPVEKYDAVHERKDTNVTVNFTAYSNEVEMEYDRLKNGGMMFLNTLSQKDYKTEPVSARDFLDYIVDRFTSSKESGNTELFMPATREVTDVTTYTLVLYGALIASTLVAWLIGIVWKRRHGPRMAKGRICTSVTTYEGLVQLLKPGGGDCKGDGEVEFGLVRDGHSGLLKITVLGKGQQEEKLAKEGMVECCVGELKAQLDEQLRCATLSAGLDEAVKADKKSIDEARHAQ